MRPLIYDHRRADSPEVREAVELAARFADHVKAHNLTAFSVAGVQLVPKDALQLDWRSVERVLRDFASVEFSASKDPTIYGKLSEFLAALRRAGG